MSADRIKEIRERRPAVGDYDPIEVLREEVQRFKMTNRFTPMQVTGFYIQAAIVLHYVDDLEAELARLKSRLADALKVTTEATIEHVKNKPR